MMCGREILPQVASQAEFRNRTETDTEQACKGSYSLVRKEVVWKGFWEPVSGLGIGVGIGVSPFPSPCSEPIIQDTPRFSAEHA